MEMKLDNTNTYSLISYIIDNFPHKWGEDGEIFFVCPRGFLKFEQTHKGNILHGKEDALSWIDTFKKIWC